MQPPFGKLAKLLLFLPGFRYFGSNKALGGLFPLQLEANSPPPFFKGYFSQIGPVVKIMKYWVKYYFHNRKTTGLLYGCCVPVVKIIFYPVFHYFHNSHTTRLLCGCCENKGGRYGLDLIFWYPVRWGRIVTFQNVPYSYCFLI